jgi:hypothetical protein
MSTIISSEEFYAGGDFIGHLEYYEAIFEREGLVTREGEFRSAKLGLTLELLTIMSIPEDLKTELISAVINAWRLEAPEKSLAQRKNELKMLLQSIRAVKSAAIWAKEHPSPMIGQQLDVAVMFALPLTSSDLMPEDVSGVRGLLCQVMDYYSATIEGGMVI